MNKFKSKRKKMSKDLKKKQMKQNKKERIFVEKEKD